MEAHRRQVRRALRQQAKRHGGSDNSTGNNSEEDDEQEDEDELNALGTNAFARLPGAWWSVRSNANSTCSDVLASASLSLKVCNHFG